jgi:uncharacterized repeat protein (TIGR01451 family)
MAYTLTVTNTGQVDYTAEDPASLTDDLSGVLDDAAYNGDANASAGSLAYTAPSLSWSGPLAVGAVVTITYSVTVDHPDAADHRLDNTVSNPPGSGGSCVPESTDPGCRVIVPVRQYTVAKSSSSAGTVHPGQAVPYVLTVTNTGGAAYTDASPASTTDSLTAVLDDATYNGDAAATAGAVSFADPVLSWSGPIEVGGTVTITYSVTLDSPDTGDGTLTNAVTPSAPGGLCSDAEPAPCPPVVLQVGTYTVLKTSTPAGTVHPGDTIAYTITVHNPSNGDFTAADPAAFTDDLTQVLDDAAYNHDAQASAGVVTVAGPVLSWSGQLPAGATVTVRYSVTVHDPTTGDGRLTNAALPSAPGGACENGAEPPCSPTTNDVQSFTVTKTASTPGPLHSGNTVTYQITVRNTGAVDYTSADPASFGDDLSRVLDDARYNDDATASTGAVSYRAPTLSWTGSLAAGTMTTITYTLTVKAPTTGDHILTNAVVTPARTGGNCPADTDRPGCSVDVPVLSFHTVKHASSSRPAPGQRVTYTITVTNTGAADFTASDPAAVEDDLTNVLDDADYNDDARADSGAVSYASPHLSWSGPIPVGESVQITYSVTVKDPDDGDRTLQNAITTTGDGNCLPGGHDADCRTSSIVDVPAPPADPITATPATGDGLAATGTTIAWGLGLVALVLVGVGAGMSLIRRRRID